MQPKRFLWLLWFPLMYLALTTSRALASDVPSPDTDVAAWLQALYHAVTGKEWGVVVGLALVGIVYPLRRFGPDIFKTKLGGLVLAFAVSLAGTLGLALAAGVHPTLGLVAGALSTAATAAGVWEWLKAHVPGVADASRVASTSSSESSLKRCTPVAQDHCHARRRVDQRVALRCS